MILKTELNSTWSKVVWADCTDQVMLPLIIPFAQQLTFFHNKLISFAQLLHTNAAAEAAEVVNTTKSPHDKLSG